MGDICLGDDMLHNIENQIKSRAQEDLQKQIDKFPQSKEVSITVDRHNGNP